MHCGRILVALSLCFLAACDKNFDEKYDDNLEKLHQESMEIKAAADQQLDARREADRVLQSDDEIEPGIATDIPVTK